MTKEDSNQQLEEEKGEQIMEESQETQQKQHQQMEHKNLKEEEKVDPPYPQSQPEHSKKRKKTNEPSDEPGKKDTDQDDDRDNEGKDNTDDGDGSSINKSSKDDDDHQGDQESEASDSDISPKKEGTHGNNKGNVGGDKNKGNESTCYDHERNNKSKNSDENNDDNDDEYKPKHQNKEEDKESMSPHETKRQITSSPLSHTSLPSSSLPPKKTDEPLALATSSPESKSLHRRTKRKYKIQQRSSTLTKRYEDDNGDGSNNTGNGNDNKDDDESKNENDNNSSYEESHDTESKCSLSKGSYGDDAGSDDEDENESNNDVNDNDNHTKKRKLQESVVDLESGTVTFPIKGVHEHLTCTLCNGLFRDPFTISECLHTFCRSCIIFAFQDIGLTSCPRCNVALGPDPFKVILFDRTLQELVDKLFPELKERDTKEEKTFWDSLEQGMEEKVACVIARNAVANDDVVIKEKVKEEGKDDNDASENNQNDTFSISTRSQSKTNSNKVDSANLKARNEQNEQQILNYTPSKDEISLKLYPLQGGQEKSQLPPLEKPLLQTSGRLRIIHLKKYIIQQLALESILPESMEIRCNGDHVGDELSLTFISKTRWLESTTDLTLHYRLDGKYID